MVHVQRITKYNIPKDCCGQEYCDRKSTHFIHIKYNGMRLHIPLCDYHAEEMQKTNGSTQDE